MFEVHLEWQLPGDPESTKLKIRLPIATPPAATYDATAIARSYEQGYEDASSARFTQPSGNDIVNQIDTQILANKLPETFVSDPVGLGPSPLHAPQVPIRMVNQRGLPVLEPYDGPRKQKNHPATRDVRQIIRLSKLGYTYSEIADATRFAKTTISRVVNGTHSPVRRGTRPASN